MLRACDIADGNTSKRTMWGVLQWSVARCEAGKPSGLATEMLAEACDLGRLKRSAGATDGTDRHVKPHLTFGEAHQAFLVQLS